MSYITEDQRELLVKLSEPGVVIWNRGPFKWTILHLDPDAWAHGGSYTEGEDYHMTEARWQVLWGNRWIEPTGYGNYAITDAGKKALS